MPAALLAQLVEHLHGKEGVDGSSPSEGLNKRPGNRPFMLDRVVSMETWHAFGDRSWGQVNATSVAR
jgi:hypothetical protein